MDVLGSQRTLRASAVAAPAALTALGLGASSASAGEKPTVTPDGPKGLDNPRRLAFGRNGRLYVAESGHGGGECIPPEHEEEEGNCVGFTSAINSIDAHAGHQVLSGLVSLAGKAGFGAEGIEGLSVDNDGGLFVVVGPNANALPHRPILTSQPRRSKPAEPSSGGSSTSGRSDAPRAGSSTRSLTSGSSTSSGPPNTTRN
jgi:hypothetical protein